MNIAELARRLRINAQELRDKLPELGFNVGQKAIKIDDQLASKIIRAWHEFAQREKQKAEYFKISQGGGRALQPADKKIEVPSVLTVNDFASLLKMPVTSVISVLMKNGVMASMNQRIDFETAAIVAADLGYEATEISLEKKVELDKAKRIGEKLALEKPADLKPRPPIVVVMGHVDHGKTRLLDAIRKTNVMEGEAGGITQHIGAYQVEKSGKKLTFIDTPGHEAFTAMRSRGAKAADIAILVVAATEGVMPQTVEALKIAQEAEVPIVVAVNKIDLPEANPEKVKQELAQYNLLAEEWGGKTIFVPISAKFNKNIDGLLENVLLVAAVNEDKLRANPEGEFVGSIVESHVSAGVGPMATVLVRNGSLRVGDYLVIDGVLYGRVKAMRDDRGGELQTAVPAQPAEITGFKVAPRVGDVLEIVDNPKKARKTKVYKMAQDETFIKQAPEEQKTAEADIAKLLIILRSDVLGSQEAVIESLAKMESPEFKVEIISKGLGSVLESDVLSAEATGALVFGFNVPVSSAAMGLAQDKKVEIKTYKIIYELLDEIKRRKKMVVKAKIVRRDLGKVQVLALFKKTNDWQVVGGKVKDGRIEPNSKAAVLRAENFITSGKITELQIGKQSVPDADKGQECGIKFIGQPLIEVNDILDIYKEEEGRNA